MEAPATCIQYTDSDDDDDDCQWATMTIPPPRLPDISRYTLVRQRQSKEESTLWLAAWRSG